MFESIGQEAWFGAARTGGHVLVILLLAWLAMRLVPRLVGLAISTLSAKSDDPDMAKRLDTLSQVFRYFANVVLLVVTGMLVLATLGISIAPILGAAGVVGIAVGFGAQSLVKDYFTGAFLLLDDQIRRGDVVQVAGLAGLVEEVTLRYVRLRDVHGDVHFIPCGLIDKVTNKSREFGHAVIDLGVAYREDVEEVMASMLRVGEALRADPVFGPLILEEMQMMGVEQLADSAVVIRCRFKTQPLKQWEVRREFLRRAKAAFDAEGIEIPYPHLTVYQGAAKDGSAPPLFLAGPAALPGKT